MLYLKDYNETKLANKIKQIEKEYETYLDPTLTHFIRCDGRGFKNFCRGFKAPFDDIFRNTIERTMIELSELLVFENTRFHTKK